MNERGTTLVEVLVTVALISVAVLASASLIVQSVRVLESSSRSLSDPGAVLAGSWMRRDVHSALSIHVGPGLWSSGSLVLNGGDGELIVYEQHNARLLRKRIAQDGTVVDSRTVLQGVVQWRWRAAASRVVEVELTLPSHIDPTIASGIADHRRRAEITLRREVFVFALRAAGSGSW